MVEKIAWVEGPWNLEEVALGGSMFQIAQHVASHGDRGCELANLLIIAPELCQYLTEIALNG